MKADDFLPKQDDEPLINKAMEDLLATAVTEEDRLGHIHAFIWIGVEYLAREGGREHAREALKGFDQFVRDAQPTRPWPT